MEIFKDELTDMWEVKCPKCNSDILNKNGKYRGRQRFICLDCGFSFTTYSKSILDSTKLTEDQWEMIIKGVLDNTKLKEISEEVNISLMTVSKIRRKIFDALYSSDRFNKYLAKHFYDPFDTTTIFIPNIDYSKLYYYQYNEESILAFIEYKNGKYLSSSYSRKDFNTLMTSINYPKLIFVPFIEIERQSAITHIEGLIAFLKTFRGIKKELLSQYSNFYDFKTNYDNESLVDRIIHRISTHKKKNG